MAAAAKQVNARASGGQLNWPLAALPFLANDHAKSASGGAAAVTISADASLPLGPRPINLRQIMCGYDGTPAAGATIQVKDGTTVIWEQPVTAAGPYVFTFDPPKSGTANTAMVVTLSAGGGSVLAYLDVSAWVEQ